RDKEALINKRRDDQDDGDADEGADAVKFIEAVEIVEEKLGERDDEQRHAGITDPAGVFSHADEKQRKGVERPRDRISHVAGEIAGKREGQGRTDGKIIGDLNVEEKEGEDGA